MDWLAAIIERIHDLRCPTCGSRLDEATVRGVASEEGRFVVQIGCRSCGEASIAVIERAREERAESALTIDDVLDAHDVLARWDGPLGDALGGSP